MRIRDLIKRYLPSYRTEERMTAKLDALRKDLREMDKKNEYLFMLSQMQPGEDLQDVRRRIHLQLPKATGRLRNIQMAENYILQRVKDICDANGMELFLVGGTLMGAVRHKGFIPWDNDIDIGMMRGDFLKLKELLARDEELVLDYCYNYEAGLKVPKVKFRASKAIFIDVFLFDYVDVGEDSASEVWEETKRINSGYSAKLREIAAPYLPEYGCRPMENAAIDQALAAVEQEMEQKFGRFGKGEWFCETLDSPYWSRDPRGIVRVADRFPLVKDAVEFEGKKYDAWRNYEDALTHFFGDFWSLPFSVSEPHTTEFDEGLEEAFAYLRQRGILE